MTGQQETKRTPDRFTNEDDREWFLKSAYTREQVEAEFDNPPHEPHSITTVWGWIGERHGEPWMTPVAGPVEGAVEFWQVRDGWLR